MGQNLGIVGRELEPDVERFLHIRALSRVERFVEEPDIAAIAANSFNRELLLRRQRQLEKPLGLGERLGEQFGVDAVIDDIEEADVAACRADGFGDGVKPRFAVLHRREIDDRDCRRHASLPL